MTSPWWLPQVTSSRWTRHFAPPVQLDICPFKAIQVNEMSVVNWEACIGCGVCVGQCPNEAMSLVRDERKGIPLDVRLLAQEQAV
jgi:Fe-S-cluster-containing hydrogenase component 2